MSWLNPDAAVEQDVLLLRGRLVYRLVDLRPSSNHKPSWSPAEMVAIATLERLACTIPGADCPPVPAAQRFVKDANRAVCALNGELVSEYHYTGPWRLFPIHPQTRTIVATGVRRLTQITPPTALATAYIGFTATLEHLLVLGRQWITAEAAGEASRAQEYYEQAYSYRAEFARLAKGLGLSECSPMKLPQ